MMQKKYSTMKIYPMSLSKIKGEKMKKFLLFLAVTAILLTGCGDKEKSTTTTTTTVTSPKITLGSMITTEPIVKKIKEKLVASGFNAETVLFDANNAAAIACKDGDLTAFVHNHKPWIDTFNKEKSANLTVVEPFIFYYRFAIYSAKHTSLDTLPDGATIVVPNDPTNLDMSLRFLSSLGFLKLGEKRENFYTMLDIKENIKNIKFFETDVATVARNMSEVDAVISSAIRVKQAGFDPAKFLVEDTTSKTFAVGLSLKMDSVKDAWVKVANDYVQSNEFKTWFADEYKGALALY